MSGDCKQCGTALTETNVRTKGDGVCRDCCEAAYDSWRAQGSPAADDPTPSKED